jgi:2-polyprenyl-3-methyl-5-hydroxy-6-metoxy-1,4-benzoquinol methylase
MATATLDQAKAEAFAGTMMQTLNDGFLGLLISVGHRTGLFDTLATLPPATSQQIADAASLNERYVREWLGGMVVGRIVEYDPSAARYHLPPEHAGFLTRAAGLNNMAFFAQYIALTGLIEKQLIDCFRNGGGVPYSAYPEFQALQAEESTPLYDTALVGAMLPLVPGIVERLEAGIDVADIGCGQGHAVNVMAQAFPNSRFVGYDFSEEGIAAGRAEAEWLGLANARFEVRDVANLGATAQFDLVTAFDTIHDQAQPRRVLRGIVESLRPDGALLMMDMAASSRLEENIEHPMGPLLYAASTFHCMTVSLAQGGEGLGTVWGEQKAAEYLTEAGFTSVEAKHLDGDFFHVFFVASKS